MDKSERVEQPSHDLTGGTLRSGLASIGALIAAALLIALIWQVSLSNKARDEALAREQRSYDLLVIIRGLDAAMARSEAALGRFVISGEKRTGALYYDQWRLAGANLKRLASLTAQDPRQAALVRALEAAYQVRGRELADPATRATYRQGWQALSQFNDAGKATSIQRIASLLERIAANERASLGQLSVEAARRVAWSNRLARLMSVAGLLLVVSAIALGWLTISAIAERQRARRTADRESDRAAELERAVDARTSELREANVALLHEAETRAAAEAQLRQVQKMEAVGQLTGGIAHDFNNMLAVVVGGLDLARRRLDGQGGEVARHIDNAMDGATRAAALTKRLLAFARAEPLLPESVTPARLILGMSDLIDRTLGERIMVDIEAPDAPWQAWCDPHQLENAIVNLAVNARDAMDGEGRLTITSDHVTLSDGEVGEAPAGEYVRISVSDQGCGMAQDVIDRVFEPFFTTKPVGKGTGLGLSQVFGFARQSGGDVAIRSRVGVGTTVAIYLPRATASAVPAAPTMLRSDPAAGDQPQRASTLLVVEDDARVRIATIEALEELGHDPIACASGEEALAVLDERDDIDLVITDVVMPGMTGPQLMTEIEARNPAMRILFVTGYVGDAGDAAQFRGREVLRKPFTVVALADALSNALNRPIQPDKAAA
ncbi:ATP-binding protein [Sphingomonas sp. 1P06PA]|uniref:ATP-binding protein n=1 Tax=Sphingomonas sp. 1P06PA TaxID=554121 RepID=UPI0039A4D6DC